MTQRRVTLKVLAAAPILLGAAPPEGPQTGDLLVRTDDDSRLPLTPAAIVADARPTLAWAWDAQARRPRDGSRLHKLALVRVDPATCDEATRARAADGGVLAYSAVCTHDACDVSHWRPNDQTLLCPCHFSKFKAALGAKVTVGPAPRPLPGLPLAVDSGGRLVVAGAFTGIIGA